MTHFALHPFFISGHSATVSTFLVKTELLWKRAVRVVALLPFVGKCLGTAVTAVRPIISYYVPM